MSHSAEKCKRGGDCCKISKNSKGELMALVVLVVSIVRKVDQSE